MHWDIAPAGCILRRGGQRGVKVEDYLILVAGAVLLDPFTLPDQAITLHRVPPLEQADQVFLGQVVIRPALAWGGSAAQWRFGWRRRGHLC